MHQAGPSVCPCTWLSNVTMPFQLYMAVNCKRGFDSEIGLLEKTSNLPIQNNGSCGGWVAPTS